MTPEGVAAPARKPSRDETLVKALVRAHRWRRRIESGQAKSITDLAEHEGITDAYVCRLLPLTCLAPDIMEAILDGRQPKGFRRSDSSCQLSSAWIVPWQRLEVQVRTARRKQASRLTCSPEDPSVDMRVRHQETDDEEEPVQRGADHWRAA